MSRDMAIRCPMVNGMACYFWERVDGGFCPDAAVQQAFDKGFRVGEWGF